MDHELAVGPHGESRGADRERALETEEQAVVLGE